MAASKVTIIAVYDVLQKHLSPEQISGILNDLIRVRGNSSFENTICALMKQHVDKIKLSKE